MLTHATEPVYNVIGKTYDITRKADPAITKKIIQCLRIQENKKYLDIGCGSGNYTGALSSEGIRIDGIDISAAMLVKAKVKYPSIQWHQGDARQLPFQTSAYGGAICILATHHIRDINAAFKEAFRVIKQGRLVLFTATPEQCQQYWLREYFPQMIAKGSQLMASGEQLKQALSSAGFEQINFEPYFIANGLQDLFLHAGKYRPEIYLDPSVRAGISSFHLCSYQDEVATGLAQLKKDIDSGKITEVIKKYESSLGDYVFVTAAKV